MKQIVNFIKILKGEDKMSDSFLYRAVLEQTYKDVLDGYEEFPGELETFINSEDFQIFCEFAELPYEKTLHTFKTALSGGNNE